MLPNYSTLSNGNTLNTIVLMNNTDSEFTLLLPTGKKVNSNEIQSSNLLNKDSTVVDANVSGLVYFELPETTKSTEQDGVTYKLDRAEQILVCEWVTVKNQNILNKDRSTSEDLILHANKTAQESVSARMTFSRYNSHDHSDDLELGVPKSGRSSNINNAKTVKEALINSGIQFKVNAASLQTYLDEHDDSTIADTATGENHIQFAFIAPTLSLVTSVKPFYGEVVLETNNYIYDKKKAVLNMGNFKVMNPNPQHNESVLYYQIDNNHAPPRMFAADFEETQPLLVPNGITKYNEPSADGNQVFVDQCIVTVVRRTSMINRGSISVYEGWNTDDDLGDQHNYNSMDTKRRITTRFRDTVAPGTNPFNQYPLMLGIHNPTDGSLSNKYTNPPASDETYLNRQITVENPDFDNSMDESSINKKWITLTCEREYKEDGSDLQYLVYLTPHKVNKTILYPHSVINMLDVSLMNTYYESLNKNFNNGNRVKMVMRTDENGDEDYLMSTINSTLTTLETDVTSVSLKTAFIGKSRMEQPLRHNSSYIQESAEAGKMDGYGIVRFGLTVRGEIVSQSDPKCMFQINKCNLSLGSLTLTPSPYTSEEFNFRSSCAVAQFIEQQAFWYKSIDRNNNERYLNKNIRYIAPHKQYDLDRGCIPITTNLPSHLYSTRSNNFKRKAQIEASAVLATPAATQAAMFVADTVSNRNRMTCDLYSVNYNMANAIPRLSKYSRKHSLTLRWIGIYNDADFNVVNSTSNRSIQTKMMRTRNERQILDNVSDYAKLRDNITLLVQALNGELGELAGDNFKAKKLDYPGSQKSNILEILRVENQITNGYANQPKLSNNSLVGLTQSSILGQLLGSVKTLDEVVTVNESANVPHNNLQDSIIRSIYDYTSRVIAVFNLLNGTYDENKTLLDDVRTITENTIKVMMGQFSINGEYMEAILDHPLISSSSSTKHGLTDQNTTNINNFLAANPLPISNRQEYKYLSNEDQFKYAVYAIVAQAILVKLGFATETAVDFVAYNSSGNNAIINSSSTALAGVHLILTSLINDGNATTTTITDVNNKAKWDQVRDTTPRNPDTPDVGSVATLETELITEDEMHQNYGKINRYVDYVKSSHDQQETYSMNTVASRTENDILFLLGNSLKNIKSTIQNTTIPTKSITYYVSNSDTHKNDRLQNLSIMREITDVYPRGSSSLMVAPTLKNVGRNVGVMWYDPSSTEVVEHSLSNDIVEEQFGFSRTWNQHSSIRDGNGNPYWKMELTKTDFTDSFNDPSTSNLLNSGQKTTFSELYSVYWFNDKDENNELLSTYLESNGIDTLPLEIEYYKTYDDFIKGTGQKRLLSYSTARLTDLVYITLKFVKNEKEVAINARFRKYFSSGSSIVDKDTILHHDGSTSTYINVTDENYVKAPLQGPSEAETNRNKLFINQPSLRHDQDIKPLNISIKDINNDGTGEGTTNVTMVTGNIAGGLNIEITNLPANNTIKLRETGCKYRNDDYSLEIADYQNKADFSKATGISSELTTEARSVFTSVTTNANGLAIGREDIEILNMDDFLPTKLVEGTTTTLKDDKNNDVNYAHYGPDPDKVIVIEKVGEAAADVKTLSLSEVENPQNQAPNANGISSTKINIYLSLSVNKIFDNAAILDKVVSAIWDVTDTAANAYKQLPVNAITSEYTYTNTANETVTRLVLSSMKLGRECCVTVNSLSDDTTVTNKKEYDKMSPWHEENTDNSDLVVIAVDKTLGAGDPINFVQNSVIGDRDYSIGSTFYYKVNTSVNVIGDLNNLGKSNTVMQANIDAIGKKFYLVRTVANSNGYYTNGLAPTGSMYSFRDTFKNYSRIRGNYSIDSDVVSIKRDSWESDYFKSEVVTFHFESKQIREYQTSYSYQYGDDNSLDDARIFPHFTFEPASSGYFDEYDIENIVVVSNYPSNYSYGNWYTLQLKGDFEGSTLMDFNAGGPSLVQLSPNTPAAPNITQITAGSLPSLNSADLIKNVLSNKRNSDAEIAANVGVLTNLSYRIIDDILADVNGLYGSVVDDLKTLNDNLENVPQIIADNAKSFTRYLQDNNTRAAPDTLKTILTSVTRLAAVLVALNNPQIQTFESINMKELEYELNKYLGVDIGAEWGTATAHEQNALLLDNLNNSSLAIGPIQNGTSTDRVDSYNTFRLLLAYNVFRRTQSESDRIMNVGVIKSDSSFISRAVSQISSVKSSSPQENQLIRIIENYNIAYKLYEAILWYMTVNSMAPVPSQTETTPTETTDQTEA
jgi:hypothetical protein